MAKTNKKQSRKSFTDAKVRSIKFRLLEKVQGFLRPSNTTITIIVKKKRLTKEECTDIQKMLKIDEELTITDAKTEWEYSRHSRTVKVNDPQKFKSRLLKCQKKYPHLAIFADSISFRKRFGSLISVVIGGMIAVAKFIIDIFW